ncbi:hypothetical protein ACFQAT_26295 [Undibacterium arcticum]
MQVLGSRISPSILLKLRERMQESPFNAAGLEGIANDQGVSRKDDLAMLVTERLIQRERLAGNIMLEGQIWIWVGER